MLDKDRLDYLVEKINEERVNIENETIYQSLITLDGLYDLKVREAEKLLRP